MHVSICSIASLPPTAALSASPVAGGPKKPLPTEPWRPAGKKEGAAAGVAGAAGTTPTAPPGTAKARESLVSRASFSRKGSSKKLTVTKSELTPSPTPPPPEPVVPEVAVFVAERSQAGLLEAVAEDEEPREPKLWKCNSNEFLGTASPLPRLSGGPPVAPPPLIIPPPTETTPPLSSEPTSTTTNHNSYKSAAQAGTPASLNETDLEEALAKIRLAHQDTAATEDSLLGQTGSPRPAPAVPIDEALAFMTQLSKSSNYQERLLFVDCVLGAARHLGARVAQAHLVGRLSDLASDPVANVRLAVARLLARPDWPTALGGSAAIAHALLERMRADADRDVAREASAGLQTATVKVFSAPLARFLSLATHNGGADGEGGVGSPMPHGSGGGSSGFVADHKPAAAPLMPSINAGHGGVQLQATASKRKLLTPVET